MTKDISKNTQKQGEREDWFFLRCPQQVQGVNRLPLP